ncbi:hypothetical protein BDN71DRAFT_1436776 [Pleurotus eryngii]|uniref:Uncharacterized protein n=1 Tax=Pleurotus eryngii TaxID=5323 RepID=A0A9P6D0F8_PLEER|nr:hypothetical protein BDN71DRAFT_1436776 [Pleurotus eryngii]
MHMCRGQYEPLYDPLHKSITPTSSSPAFEATSGWVLAMGSGNLVGLWQSSGNVIVASNPQRWPDLDVFPWPLHLAGHSTQAFGVLGPSSMALYLLFAGPDTPTVIAISPTAPGLSVSSVSRHPFTFHCAIQVNPQEPAPDPEDPTVATSHPLTTASVQEGDKSKTPLQKLKDNSACLASATKVPYFKCNQYSRTPAVTIIWYASCGTIHILLPPATFNAEALPEQYNLFIHTIGTEHQVWIWDEGAWKSIKLEYSMCLKGMVHFLIIKNGKPSWVQKDMYLKRSHKS